MHVFGLKNNFNIARKNIRPLTMSALGLTSTLSVMPKSKQDSELNHEEKNFISKMNFLAEKYKEAFDTNIINSKNGSSELLATVTLKSGVIEKMYKEGKLSDNAIKQLFKTAKNAISKEDFNYFAKNKIAITPYDNDYVIDARYYNAVMPSIDIKNKNYQKIKSQIIKEETLKIDKVSCDKKMVLVTGLPAAGKTTVVKNVLGDKLTQYYNPDPDEFKSKFEPYYSGGKGSTLVHNASVDIMNSPEIMGRVYKEGRNFIKQTIASATSLKEIINDAKSKGYDVTLVHVNIDAESSKQRAVQRFKSEGRFLDPSLVSELNYHSVAYDKIVPTLLKDTDIEIYEYDNNGDFPKLINHYDKRS